jgi:hypothetical protein
VRAPLVLALVLVLVAGGGYVAWRLGLLDRIDGPTMGAEAIGSAYLSAPTVATHGEDATAVPDQRQEATVDAAVSC